MHMENEIQTITQTHLLPQMHYAIDRLSGFETLIFIAIIFSSLLLGSLLNRAIDTIPHRNWKSKLIDFLAPLLASLTAIGLTGIAHATYRHLEIDMILLPLALKVTVAWFAIRLVMLMTSRKTAGWVASLLIAPVTLLHLFNVWKPLTKTLKSLEISIGTFDITVYAIIKTLVTICVLIWLTGFITSITEVRLKKLKNLRASNRILIMKMFQIFLYFFVFIFALQLIGIDLTALSVFGGALGVGLGFGLQKIASNFVSGIILLFEKSIEVDDMIELSDGTSGFVRHTGARFTRIETVDGKELLIPNEDFITQRVASWTYSNKKARVEIRVSVEYESDLHQVRSIMLGEAAKHPRCIKTPAPMCVLDAFGDHGIGLILHFWVADVTDGRMEPKSDVMLAIWDQFKANNISIPYPQQVLRVLKSDEASLPTAIQAAPQL